MYLFDNIDTSSIDFTNLIVELKASGTFDGNAEWALFNPVNAPQLNLTITGEGTLTLDCGWASYLSSSRIGESIEVDYFPVVTSISGTEESGSVYFWTNLITGDTEMDWGYGIPEEQIGIDDPVVVN